MNWLSKLNISKPMQEATQQMFNVLFEGINVNFDDNLASKFADTTRDISKVTQYIASQIIGFGEKFETWLREHLTSEKYRYNATMSFNLSDMNLSDDFIKMLPPKLYIRFVQPEHSMACGCGSNKYHVLAYADTEGLLIDLENGDAEYALIGFIIYPNMDNCEQISNIIKWKLPHELRHVVDTCDKATLEMMEECLHNNRFLEVTENFDSYWNDTGEYQARLSELCACVIPVLENPEYRKKIHSASELVSKMANTNIYKGCVGNVDEATKAQFNNHAEAILAKIMDKLI